MSNISVEPDTIVKLLRCGLQRGSGHQLTFANATAQQTYFESRVLYSYTDFTYVRENNSIAVGQNVEDIRDCNYMMYQNKNFGNNKWFYAFVTDLEYVNENCTRVYFETDSWQTWVWDIDLHPIFIEREHTNDDTVGANLVPETIETGDYYCTSTDYYDGLDDIIYVIQATEQPPNYDPSTENIWNDSTSYGGIPLRGDACLASNMAGVEQVVNDYRSKPNAIYNVYAIPKNFITHHLDGTRYRDIYVGDNSPKTQTKTIYKPSSVAGIQVKNNKLLTFPYVYLLVSNNNGSSNLFRYEDWEQPLAPVPCSFTITGVPTVGGSIKLTPSGSYKQGAEENGLMAGKFPLCNWGTDPYTNWLTQNSVNLNVGVASSTLQGTLGVVTAAVGTAIGGPAGLGMAMSGIGTTLSSATQIGNTVGSVYQHSMQPESAVGNTNGGDVNVCGGKNGFFFYHMSIKPEMVTVIDNYFSLYGYQTNKVKYPNLGMTLNNTNYKGRLNWNYVKTIGCTFDAKNSSKMSRQDEINIQQMFDNGVTLWHNPATMYDYSQPNTIVS